MSYELIRIIARYHSKSVVRDWGFWLAVIFAQAGGFLFQFFNQTNITGNWVLGDIANDSFFPYSSAFFWVILQTVPLFICAGNSLVSRRQPDTVDVIHARPQSNAEIVAGVTLSTLRIFLLLCLSAFTLASIIQFAGTTSISRLYFYFFYAFTLILPALLFFTGTALVAYTLIPQRSIVFILFISLYSLGLYLLFSVHRAFPDPWGVTLPAIFSRITGFPDIWNYLFQRLFWAFLGVALCTVAVRTVARMPNHPNEPRKAGQIMLLLLMLAFIPAIAFIGEKVHDRRIRAQCKAVAREFSGKPAVNITSQEIFFTRKHNRMEVSCSLQLRNPGTTTLEEIVLYLNPGLKISGIYGEGRELTFYRKAQAICIPCTFQPGESKGIDILYRGKIEESGCYPDIPDDIFFASLDNSRNVYRFGKRYAYLQKGYTLLTPEALWYPVSRMTTTVFYPHFMQKEFTWYTLRVLNKGEETVISQGVKSQSGDTTIYAAEYPLTGLSLCIGDFSLTELVNEDSVSIRLYVPEKDRAALQDFPERDSVQGMVRDCFSFFEENYRMPYPFNCFQMVETPESFFTYYRYSKNGSEYIQPEMILTEAGFFKSLRDRVERAVIAYKAGRSFYPTVEIAVRTGVKNQFVSDFHRQKLYFGPEINPLLRFFNETRYLARYNDNNPYALTPLFFYLTSGIDSRTYPVLDLMIDALLDPKDDAKSGSVFDNFNVKHDQAVSLLHSSNLKTILSDSTISGDMIFYVFRLKTEDLRNRLTLGGNSEEKIKNFLLDYKIKQRFNNPPLSDFRNSCFTWLGVDIDSLLPRWYNTKSIPGYEIRNVYVQQVLNKETEMPAEEDISGYKVCLDISNSSETSGVVEVEIFYKPEGPGYSSKSPSEQPALVKQVNIESGKSSSIAYILKEKPIRIYVNTGISKNIPSILTYPGFIPTNPKYTTDTTQGVKVSGYYNISPIKEIIVDNKDTGFTANNPPSRKRLSDYFSPKDKLGMSSLERFMASPGSDYNFRDSAGNLYTYNVHMQKNDKVSQQWHGMISSDFYGKYFRSCVFKYAGEGKAWVNWSHRIETPGWYDISVYVSNIQRSQWGHLRSLTAGESQHSVPEQYYTVRHRDGENEIILKNLTPEAGWYSLGKFYLNEGENVVILSDKGVHPQQRIFGDAVKWSYIGDQ